MIARLWHGAVPFGKSTEYLQRMRTIAIPDYRRTPGNRAAYCLHRIEGGVAHFEMLTFWEDVEAIKRFAGSVQRQAATCDSKHPPFRLASFGKFSTVSCEGGWARREHVLCDRLVPTQSLENSLKDERAAQSASTSHLCHA